MTTLDEIHNLWNTDKIIDNILLDDEALNISKLHGKYLRILSNERMLHTKYTIEFNRLNFDKYVFYTDGPTEETIAKGWVFAPKGKILKTEVQRYLDSDIDLITVIQKIAIQKEKIDVLTSIMNSLDKRTFQIQNALSFKKWESGN
jgi:hypothetical protein